MKKILQRIGLLAAAVLLLWGWQGMNAKADDYTGNWTVGINDFIAAGFISSNQLVKVLGNGTLTTKLDVQAHAFSKTAVAAIEAAGGSVVKL